MSDVSNYQPVLGNFDSAGNLLQMWGPNGKVAFDPTSVALTGGVIGTSPIASAPKLAKIRKAIAAVRSGQSSGKVFCIGDSTTLGFNTQASPNAYVAARPTSWPVAAAAQLASMGIKATANSLNPNSNNGGLTISSLDPRFTGTWTPGGFATLGGGMFQPSGAASTLSLALTDSTDTVDIWYVSNSGNGNIAVNVDGGATLQTINTNAAQLLRKATVTYALGAHTLNLVGDSANIFLVALRAYNSAAKELTFFNFGWGGGSVANFIGASTIWSPETVIQSLAPDLTVICLTINDIGAGTSLATYQASLQKIITAAQVTGDVILLNGAPSGTTQYAATAASYLAVVQALAVANNCIVADTDARFVNYTAANSLGLMADTLHPNIYGAQDIAASIANALARI